MNSSELGQWFRHHDAAFPGFRDWANRADEDETLRIRQMLWVNRLKNVPMLTAAKATETMFNKNVDLPFGKHLGWVCEFHQRINPPKEEWSPRCKLCNETGIVSVRFFADRLTYGGNPLPGNVGQAACRCSKGQQLNDRRENSPDGSPMERFDHKTMEVSRLEQKPREAIVESLRAYGNLRLANIIQGLGLS